MRRDGVCQISETDSMLSSSSARVLRSHSLHPRARMSQSTARDSPIPGTRAGQTHPLLQLGHLRLTVTAPLYHAALHLATQQLRHAPLHSLNRPDPWHRPRRLGYVRVQHRAAVGREDAPLRHPQQAVHQRRRHLDIVHRNRQPSADIAYRATARLQSQCRDNCAHANAVETLGCVLERLRRNRRAALQRARPRQKFPLRVPLQT